MGRDFSDIFRFSHFGTRWSNRTDANNTAFEDFFTDFLNFTVKEIEVFETADETALPADVQKCTNGSLFREMARNAGGRLLKSVTSRG
jgi:hypothetical protein